MQLFDPKNPNEKKKMIAAAVLGLAAIIVLGYAFLGGSSAKPTAGPARPSPTPLRVSREPQAHEVEDDFSIRTIDYHGTNPALSEADRNIFAYYERPPAPVKLPSPPPPTPTPPLAVSSLTPTNVSARTREFSLQVMGDKFTPAVQIIVDGRPMQTRFINSQQLATTVTADMIANPGNRQIMVRSPDGSLYSGYASLTVTPPPVPNYTYVGLIGKPRFNDTAVLQEKNSKDFLNVV